MLIWTTYLIYGIYLCGLHMLFCWNISRCNSMFTLDFGSHAFRRGDVLTVLFHCIC